MEVAAWIILFIIVAIILAFNRASLIVATIAYTFLLIVVSVFSHASVITLSICWVIFALLSVVLNVLPLRRQLISQYLIRFFRKAMPSMSATEKEALTAGGVGWEGEIFTGMPDWNKLTAIAAEKLSAEEQAFIDGPVNELCAMIDNWDINQRQFNIPIEIWQHLRKHGFFGFIIPKKYGGKEFSALAHSQIIAKISSVSVAVATVVSVPNSLGPAELLLHYGTQAQKDYYLPRLATGEEIPCFALTSPLAGSDASAIVDNGVICRHRFDGEEKLAIRLNWNKRYITLSPVATLIGLAFKLYDPDHLLGEQENLGITCALIPVNTPGVVTGRRHFPLSCAFPNGPTQGHDVIIPIDSIIGGAAMAGHGWRMLMESLAAGRSISLPSMATGGAKRVLYASGAYARIREQFHTYIGAFGGVREALTRMGAYTYLVEALRLFTVAAVDRGLQPAVASAISKCHTTELSRKILMLGMDIHGGKGICMGPHNYIAQSFIESPISITVEGANILTRSLIIFGQGAIRCHPYILSEMNAVADENQKQGLRIFDKNIFAHIGYFISNFARAFLLGLTGGRLARVPAGDLKYYYRQLSRYAAIFSLIADVAMLKMGGKLKRKEKLSARLGDLLSIIYMGSAAIKYYELQDEKELLPIMQWACDELLYQMQTQLYEFLSNFPYRGSVFILRLAVFPLGRRLKPPTDKLGADVVELLMRPSRARARLTQHVYTQAVPHNPIGTIESVLQQVIAAEPLEEKLYQEGKRMKIKGNNFTEKVNAGLEAGIITKAEAEQLLAAEAARLTITNVDDFSPEELTRRVEVEDIG
jgi:acyl-CoA dehydrogenase